jgi:hypothetical protein
MIRFLLVLIASTVRPDQARAQSGPVVRLVYFYSQDCPHCMPVISEVLTPLQAERGSQVQIKTVDISEPANYKMMIRAEEMLNKSSEARWPVPTLIIGGQTLIDEDEIRERLPCLIDTCLEKGGTLWPDVPGLAAVPLEGEEGLGSLWFAPALA